ncbi:MAG: malate dehydrogenase [Gammaproteobacteria bacterium]|nr:malate dehydrogenase [Gammaproteobacteria bacterium]
MQRKKIALIGAGHIGSMLAMMITQAQLGDIVLLDLPEKLNSSQGKVLDILALRAHAKSDIELTASADFAAISGANVVVITAGMPRRPHMTREDLLSINLAIITAVSLEVKKFAPDAYVIISTNPVDTMSQAFYELTGFPKNRVIGLSGALDSSRFRNFVALETNLSPEDVACLVMGGHGPTMIPITRTATVGGIPLAAIMTAEQINKVVERTREAGTEIVNLLGDGSAYFSSAGAILEMVEALILDKRRVICSSVLCQGEYGVEGLFIGVPAVLGANGLERIIEIELTPEEQEMLDNTVHAVSKSVITAGLMR